MLLSWGKEMIKNKSLFVVSFRIATLVLGSILIGTNMFSVKNIIATILYCCLILAVLAQLALQIAFYLLQENYIKTQKENINQKEHLINLYVNLVDKYQIAIKLKEKEIKKLKKRS